MWKLPLGWPQGGLVEPVGPVDKLVVLVRLEAWPAVPDGQVVLVVEHIGELGQQVGLASFEVVPEDILAEDKLPVVLPVAHACLLGQVVVGRSAG